MKLPIPQPLKQILTEIDGLSYKAYKGLQGKTFDFSPFSLKFEHVQGDPFAKPTRLSITFDLIQGGGYDSVFFDSPTRKLALEDFLLRRVHERTRRKKITIKGSGKSGVISIVEPSQKILKRNAVEVWGNHFTLIMFVGLPAAGRTILGREFIRLFDQVLPMLWVDALLAKSYNLQELENHVHTLEDYEVLQRELQANNWTAFVSEGAILPRASGVSNLPLKKGAVPFQPPKNLRASVVLPHMGTVHGMPLFEGITLIVGGGFHGKSTLLRAVQESVYPHIPGDGRERVATRPTAVKIRAEDGRSAYHVDISGFMNELPSIKTTTDFSTQSASGSTSQAVNIVEALESGSDLLLMDEDTCAANFMVRDARMQKLVHADREPITPYIDRIEELFRIQGVSSILVMGGSGDYFECADCIIAMDAFEPHLVTKEAKQIVHSYPEDRQIETDREFPKVKPRRLDLNRLRLNRGHKECVIEVRGLGTMLAGSHLIDTRYLEQLAESGQLETCGWILKTLKQPIYKDSGVDEIWNLLNQVQSEGFGNLVSYNNGGLALPRFQEVLAVLNRIR